MPEDKTKKYRHEDGRSCSWYPSQQRWLHWDHDHDPKPDERMSYRCQRQHELCGCGGSHDGICKDRGEFGMPTIGGGAGTLYISKSAINERMRIVNLGKGRTTITLMVEPRTSLAERIVSQHAPAALEHFIRRNAEYGDDNDFNLGPAGQYVDISRKVQKLKRRLWEHEPERDGEESNRTIVMELIGHLLMTMDMLEEMDGHVEEGSG